MASDTPARLAIPRAARPPTRSSDAHATLAFCLSQIAGFVTRDDGEGDVFVHQSDIYSQGFRSLRNQEPVEFGLEPIGDGRFKAVNVRPIRLRPSHAPDVSKSTESIRTREMG